MSGYNSNSLYFERDFIDELATDLDTSPNIINNIVGWCEFDKLRTIDAMIKTFNSRCEKYFYYCDHLVDEEIHRLNEAINDIGDEGISERLSHLIEGGQYLEEKDCKWLANFLDIKEVFLPEYYSIVNGWQATTSHNFCGMVEGKNQKELLEILFSNTEILEASEFFQENCEHLDAEDKEKVLEMIEAGGENATIAIMQVLREFDYV